MNNKRCDGPRLVKGIVNEKTTYSEEKSRETAINVRTCRRRRSHSSLDVSALSAVRGVFIALGRLRLIKTSTTEVARLPLLTKSTQTKKNKKKKKKLGAHSFERKQRNVIKYAATLEFRQCG